MLLNVTARVLVFLVDGVTVVPDGLLGVLSPLQEDFTSMVLLMLHGLLDLLLYLLRLLLLILHAGYEVLLPLHVPDSLVGLLLFLLELLDAGFNQLVLILSVQLRVLR